MMHLLLAAAISITTAAGWLESAYAEFTPQSEYQTYNAYVQAEGTSTWTQLDKELVRDYHSYIRVDALGLKKGNYVLKIVPVKNGSEVTADAATTASLAVSAHDRNGFAHADWNQGVGAYNNDGTLKSNAKVIYVSNANASTVEGGIQTYIDAIKGGPSTPVCIRILGLLEKSFLDKILSSKEGLQIKGSSSYTTMNMTIEGVGNDAGIKNFGLHFRNCTSIEVRNIAVILCMDDCIGFDTDNSHCWVHNCDFFYGQPGSAADQAKGDGTCDMKAGSKYLTFSYNHFWDSGKSSLCGMKDEAKDSYITYHHNHFDHSDSRHPRIRTMSVHIYNNYYDGNSKYGVGLTRGASAFVENNYFRACKHPIMSAQQGTDKLGEESTFSGEWGGICKAYNNTITGGSGSVIYYQNKGDDSDAYLVTNRQDTVPATVKTIGVSDPEGLHEIYNNFDKYQSSVRAITPDAPADVPTTVKAWAGRCQKGDITFTFTTADDTSYDINADLKKLITDYTPSLVRIVGGDTIPNKPVKPVPPVGEGSLECWFTADGPSSNFYTTEGSISKDKGSVNVKLVSGKDTTLTHCLKFDSQAKVNFTTTEECSLYIVFGPEETANIKIDGTKYTGTGNTYSKVLAAGAHELVKGDSRNVFYLLLTPTKPSALDTIAEKKGHTFLHEGRIYILSNGKIYDLNGCSIQ